jgi:FAD/FMN-containing dehydrogenase
LDDVNGSAYEKDNPEIRKKARELEDSLVLNAIELDGTASGEHGVGIHKLVSLLSLLVLLTPLLPQNVPY